MVRCHPELDPEALHRLPPQAEQKVYAPTGVAGLQGEREQSGWRSRWARALHWVVYSWEVSRTVGKNSYFAPHGDRSCCLTPLIPDL